MRPASELVDSGSEWYDTRPSYWRPARLNHVAMTWPSSVDKHTVPNQPAVRLCNYVDVYKNDEIDESIEFMRATATPDQVERFRLKVGDTLLTKDSETADDIGIPAFVSYEAADLLCGYHLSIVRPRVEAVFPRYLFWALGSMPMFGQWAVLASGVTRVGIRAGDLAKATILLPPMDEQRAIADFLDRETARIDTLIEEQQRLVELLLEHRISLITHQVSGEDHADRCRTRSSWYPDLPSNWQFGRVKSFATRVTDGAHISPNTDGGIYDFVSTRDINAGNIDYEGSLKTSPETYDYMVRTGCRPDPGDVLFSKDGTVGETAVVSTRREFVVASSLVIISPDPARLNSTFLAYTLASKASRDQAASMMRGAGLPRISVANLGRLEIPLPALEEQRQIVSYLDDQTTKIDQLIVESEQFIELSRERRAALITAAVTGQIDVRDEVA